MYKFCDLNHVFLVVHFKKRNTVKSCDSENKESYQCKINDAEESRESNKQYSKENFTTKFHENEDNNKEGSHL